MLDTLLTPGLAAFLRQPPLEADFRTPEDLDRALDRWGDAGADLVTLGSSKTGRPVRAACIGTGLRTLLAWGYPHPDEPMGAQALCWLGDALLAGLLPELADWRVVLVLCADPDEASRQGWLTGPTDALSFTRGVWRPSKLDWMVDYGFPLDWGPFWQPEGYRGECRTAGECAERCEPGECSRAGLPHGPLPESLALAEAIDRFCPDVVAAMHSTHSGGDYTFLLERERPEVLRALVNLPESLGLVRHLGEPIDRGRRWFSDSPDLIHEPSLRGFVRDLERMPHYDPELVYQRNHSAAAYLQATGTGAQFICPETTMFRHPDFGNTSELSEQVVARVSVEDRRRGRYELVRIDIDGEWVVVRQRRAHGELVSAAESPMPVSRGMLGVAALARRRRVLAAADLLWSEVRGVDGLTWHPYLDERRLLRTPGAFVHDRSMLIFRTREDYARQATVAQAASFRWLWPLHTATLLGNFRNFLSAQDLSRPALARADAELEELQRLEVWQAPEQMRSQGPRGPAMASMLARVLCVMLARA